MIWKNPTPIDDLKKKQVTSQNTGELKKSICKNNVQLTSYSMVRSYFRRHDQEQGKNVALPPLFNISLEVLANARRQQRE